MGPPLCPHWRPSPLPHRRPLHRRQLAGLRPVRAAGAPGGGCHLSAAVAYGQRPSNCRDSHRIRAGGFPWRYLVSSAELQPRSRGPWGKGAATVSSASAAVAYGQRSSTVLDSGELSGTADLLGDIPEVRHGWSSVDEADPHLSNYQLFPAVAAQFGATPLWWRQPRVRSRSGIKVLQECLKAQNFC